MEEIKQANKRLKAARQKVDDEYQQFIHRLDIEEERIEKRYQTLADKKKSYAGSNGNSNSSADDIIEINAGGKIITAKRGTLCQIEGTILSALFSGLWDKKLQRDNNGRIFLDVNSEAFQSIVDYLNELAISPPDNLPKMPTARDGENQINLDHLLELFLRVQPLIDSTIVKDMSDISQLHEWLGEDCSDGEFQLLYRSSRDGSEGFDFHSKCDNRGSTIAIIETASGLVLGGYSNTPWTSEPDAGSYLQAGKAFLFVLSGESMGISSCAPCKIKLRDPNSKRATLHYDKFGPSFGENLIVSGSKLKLVAHDGPYDMSNLDLFADGFGTVINEVEVFRVHGASAGNGLEKKRAESFSSIINSALNEKIETLKRAEQQVFCMEKRFDREVNFIDIFASGDTKDVVKLNVSGTPIATKRGTLLVFEESVLAQQFDDNKWTEQGMGNTSRHVKDWTPDDVFFWVQNIEDVPDDVATMFVENAIKGTELLAMSMEGLQMIGIKRAGTLCLLLKEIEKLEKATEDVSTLIEHSPYCFKVILDYLRMKQLHARNLAEAPDLPTVRDSERGRFAKVVEYYFPGDSAMLILGIGMPITIKMAIAAQVDPDSSGEVKDSLKDGRPLDKVTLVVAIQHVRTMPENNAVLGVEDGTGYMQVEIGLNDVRSEVCKEHSYVRIIGQIEDFGGNRRILADDIRALNSGNDITNHFREVAQAYDRHFLLTKQREGTTRKRKASPQRFENLSHQYPGRLDIHLAVLDSIRRLGVNSDSGVHVGRVIGDVSAPMQPIWAAITYLHTEGLIYQTIDEYHWQVAE